MESREDLHAELIVYGTPAEEAGSGKVLMIEKGVFDELDICLMSHPCPYEIPVPVCNACGQLTVTFHGTKIHIFDFDDISRIRRSHPFFIFTKNKTKSIVSANF